MDSRFVGIDKVPDSKEAARNIDENLTELSMEFYSAIKNSDRKEALALFLKIKDGVGQADES